MPLKPIPREKIPWFPSVDADRCTGCRICLEYCPNRVYDWDEVGPAAAVGRPFACVVGCSGCLDKCPVGAISFPDLEEISALLRKLRRE